MQTQARTAGTSAPAAHEEDQETGPPRWGYGWIDYGQGSQVCRDLRDYVLGEFPAENRGAIYFMTQGRDCIKVRLFQFLPPAVLPLIKGSGDLSPSHIMHRADG